VSDTQQHVIELLQETVRTSPRLRPSGAHTKHTAIEGATALDLTKLRGVRDYQPSEFIIEAYAGTPVREIAALLSEHGQYLPFDPLLIESGATIGGTVAANASGPERYRYGGVRDFIVGCHYIDGAGDLLAGGGKVVKNAAGFDYPKLFVGSNGTLGALVDVCFKVFPKPEVYNTLVAAFPAIHDALAAVTRIGQAPFDVHAVEIASQSASHMLEVRVGGLLSGIAKRMDRIRAIVGAGDIVSGPPEQSHWRTVRELAWRKASNALVKVPLTPGQIANVEARWIGFGARRYGAGGNVAYIECAPAALTRLDGDLKQANLAGQVFAGPGGMRAIGATRPNPFADRVRAVLDPKGKFAASKPV
jgi:glycolate oxidase FAD binding subunit